MHVIFISNSSGKAAAKVKAVLDSYAIRIGINTWHTPITMEALHEVKKALLSGISRHTSVACYRNVGRNNMELLWLIGNQENYDDYGRYAPETKQKEKSFPMFYRHTALLAGIAGLTHDLGKMNGQFQAKIGNTDDQDGNTKKKREQSDCIRHEWMSAWLFRQMVENKMNLIQAVQKWPDFINQDSDEIRSWMPLGNRIDSGIDAASMLIATHHYPFGYGHTNNLRALRDIANSSRHIDSNLDLEKFRKLKCLPPLEQDKAWVKFSERLAKELGRLNNIQQSNPPYWHAASLVARAALILADHFISSQDLRGLVKKSKNKNQLHLYANTIKINGKTELNQPLLHHLELVSREAKNMVGLFANPELPSLGPTTIEKITKPTEDPRFSWQDESIASLPHDVPTLVFNIAGTGSGKTRANVKLACALRKNQSLRLTSVFNLRTLTLQSYDAYCNEIGLDKNLECACLVGDPIVREIHQNLDDDSDPDKPKAEETLHMVSGAETLKAPEWMETKIFRLARGDKQRISTLTKLLAAPVLVSTIDFINAAADMTCSNADQAHALLRLLHSDLILDEVDSYDTESVVAVLRLIHVAACFGRNVIVSSATLSPTLATYVQATFVDGFKTYQQIFDKRSVAYCVLVSDLLPAKIIKADQDHFNLVYQEYISEMTDKANSVTKIFQISQELKNEKDFLNTISKNASHLHEKHHWTTNGVKVSIGLVRVANIPTCLKVAEHLISQPEFHVVTYHALEPLARRAYKEYYLDKLLNRKSNNSELEKHISSYLKNRAGEKKRAIFIVVATPVEEVGRDHDFDWAIIEPSSMHSIIQTAGRVNRHRRVAIQNANIVVLNRCYRDVSGKSHSSRVFFWPGHEIQLDATRTSHHSHEMNVLLACNFGKEKPLDTRLMFGDKKCPFAKCDELALQEKLKPIRPHLQSGQIAWFSQWFGKAYPLRQTEAKDLYSIMLNGNTPKLFKCQTRTSNDQWTATKVFKRIEIPSNAWLSPNLHEVQEWLEKHLKRKADFKDFSFTIEEWRNSDGDSLLFDWRGIIPTSTEPD